MAGSNIILPESLTFGSKTRTSAPESDNSEHNNLFQAASSEEELFDLGIEKIIDNLEKRLIAHTLQKTNHSKMRAAELLHLSFRSLRYKVKKYGLS